MFYTPIAVKYNWQFYDSAVTMVTVIENGHIKPEPHPSQAEWHLNRYLKQCNKARHDADIWLFSDSIFLYNML